MSDDNPSIGDLIESKNPQAPRITPQDLQGAIASEHYFTAGDGFVGNVARDTIEDAWDVRPPDALELLTFCVLVLKNGFTVTGESACVSPENFDAEIGRRVARENAVEKVWPLLGYALKERLHAQRELSHD